MGAQKIAEIEYYYRESENMNRFGQFVCCAGKLLPAVKLVLARLPSALLQPNSHSRPTALRIYRCRSTLTILSPSQTAHTPRMARIGGVRQWEWDPWKGKGLGHFVAGKRFTRLISSGHWAFSRSQGESRLTSFPSPSSARLLPPFGHIIIRFNSREMEAKWEFYRSIVEGGQ